MSEFKLGHSKKILHWQCNNSPNLRAPTCLQRWPHISPGWLNKYYVVPVSPQGISQQKNSGSPPPNVPMKAAAPTTLEGDTRDLWLETVWSRHVWGTRKGLVSQLQQCRFWPWRNVWLYQSDQPSWQLASLGLHNDYIEKFKSHSCCSNLCLFIFTIHVYLDIPLFMHTYVCIYIYTICHMSL
jgi:hypothetical protein